MNMIVYSIYPPGKYNKKQETNDHIIYFKKQKTWLTPLSFRPEIINPKTFLDLKKRFSIESILVLDKTTLKTGSAYIKDHVNRSGYNFLLGKTPLEGFPVFPDMSKIYNPIRGMEAVVVHTVGPERFSVCNGAEIIFSESAGLITPVWHYVGVRVRAKTQT